MGPPGKFCPAPRRLLCGSILAPSPPPLGDMGPGVPLLINESAHIYAIFNECIFMQYAVFIRIIMH